MLERGSVRSRVWVAVLGAGSSSLRKDLPADRNENPILDRSSCPLRPSVDILFLFGCSYAADRGPRAKAGAFAKANETYRVASFFYCNPLTTQCGACSERE